jgi:hypothetical protein
VFDDESFLKSRRDAAPFLSKFLTSQLFVCFIEERSWPTGDLFDFLLSKRVWEMAVDDVVPLLFKPPQRGSIVIKPQAWSTPSPIDTYFILNESDIASEPVVRPVTPYVQDLTPPLWLSEIPPVKALTTRPD